MLRHTFSYIIVIIIVIKRCIRAAGNTTNLMGHIKNGQKAIYLEFKNTVDARKISNMVQVSETQSSTEASLSSTAPAESTHQTSRYRIDIHRQRYRISRETVRHKLH